jgi:hypothetical protein
MAKRPGELRGWEEIAKHLEIPIPTARTYADVRGMPVFKLGESKSAVVVAYADQLNEWWRKMLRPRAPKKAFPRTRAA